MAVAELSQSSAERKEMRMNKRIVLISVLAYMSLCALLFSLIFENYLHYYSQERYEPIGPSHHSYRNEFVAERVSLPVNILEGQQRIILRLNKDAEMNSINQQDYSA